MFGRCATLPIDIDLRKAQPERVAVLVEFNNMDELDLEKLVEDRRRCLEKAKANIPTFIVVHPSTGYIYIADTGNHRIQVLNDDLTFNRTFGKKGLAPENSICQGMWYLMMKDICNFVCLILIIIVSRRSHQQDNNYISKFSSKRSIPSYASITIHNNLVYVSECDNNCVSI